MNPKVNPIKSDKCIFFYDGEIEAEYLIRFEALQ